MLKFYTGKSGAGKDYFAKKAIQEGFKPLVPITTRPMREGETNGVEYEFISVAEFEDRIKNNQLTEYRKYTVTPNGRLETWYYGTPLFDASENLVAWGPLECIKSIVENYGSKGIEIYYIDASDRTRKTRAILREADKPFDEIEWNRRLLADADDFSPEKIAELEKVYGKAINVIDNNM